MNTVPCSVCGEMPAQRLGICDTCYDIERKLLPALKLPGAPAALRKFLSLDDWVDGVPDAWDYNAVLAEHEAELVWDDEEPRFLSGWTLTWEHGCMFIGRTSEVNARKAAALFISLWLRGVSASFADKLMEGYLSWLECQEQTSLTFLAEVGDTLPHYIYLTREKFCHGEAMTSFLESKIISKLDPQPDEEIIVTFTKRKKL